MKRFLSLVLILAMILSLSPSTSISAAADSQVFILPAGLREIEEQAFAGNTSITTLVIPNTVTSIGAEAFEGCTGLTEVTIGGHDVAVADDAFKNCGDDIVFYTHNDSPATLWVMAHGYKSVSLDDDSDHLERFAELIAYSGFNPSLLMSSTFASMCLIVRTPEGMDRLPDISAFHPIDIFKSDDHLYYIQFATETETEDCYNLLASVDGITAEPDRIGANDDVSGQGVTLQSGWGTNDLMGFDIYAPYVAQRRSGDVTVAVIDTGVESSAWTGPISNKAASFVGGSAFTDSVKHGSKVAALLNDCLGENRTSVTLLPIKVVNSSSMYRTSVIVEAIAHATRNGANIINLSLGWDISEGTSPEIEYQLRKAIGQGVLVVAAAGNGSGNVMYPANCDGVIAVSAAVPTTSGIAVSSRTGAAIDYTAPGMFLTTAAFEPLDRAGDQQGVASTSFAAPQIAAALALIKLDSTKTEDTLSVLNSCSHPLESGGTSAYGNGLPFVNELAVIHATDIVLKNMDGGAIPSRLWLDVTGNNFMLGWTLVPSNTTNQTVTVTSSKTSVLSVRQYGNTSALISANGVGKATISVTNGEITKSFDIVVEKPVSSLLITGADDTMIVGKEKDLAVAVLPTDATNRAVTWRSSNETVLSVTDTGHIKALSPGKVTVTCEALDGFGASSQVEITVIEVPDATAISLSAVEKDIQNGKVTLELGETLTLVATITPEEAPQNCRFSVYPSGIVSVNKNGVVTTIATGTATIMASATNGDNVYTGITVTVVVSPTSVSIHSDKTTLNIGETALITAEVLPENATDKTVTWTSKSPSVASVNSSTGLVTAKAPGAAEIVGITSNGKQAAITITVRQPITITFDPAGGTCSETTRSAYASYAIGELPTTTRDYWTFDGWYTEASGGTEASAASAFTADTTLYAHWIGNSYKVHFNVNADNAQCQTAEMEAQVGTRLGALPAAIRPNYSFTGWFTSDGDRITTDYIQQNDSDLTVYAHWEAEAYAVYFDANGGSCDTPSMSAKVDSPVGELPTPTRDYYTFVGWFTARSTGTEITSAYSQSNTTELTVYARWTPNPYEMTFDANGGSCSTAEKTCYVDTPIGTPPVATRSYYDFAGWYTESGVLVTETYQQDTTANITVTARWTPRSYTMTFDPNGGNCTTASKAGTVDAKIGTLPTPTKDYYTFKGWYTAKSGGTQITADYVHKTDNDITVYAQWTAKSYTMTFDPNGGTVSPTSKPGTVDAMIGTLPTPTKAYYTFNGWFTAKSGGTEITANYVQKTDNNITVYAQWTAKPYTMTFDPNGGTVSQTSKIGTVGTKIGTLPTPTRELYSSTGWYTAKTGGTEITEDYVQETDTSTTVYAHWEPLPYTISFNGNGNSDFPATVPSPSTRIYYADTAVGDLPVPTRAYHTFNGWFTEATGGTQITSTYKHQSTATLQVYAHWTPYTFKLNLNPNGGDCSTSAMTCSVGAAIGALPIPTREHYTFDGWFTAASGGSQVTASNAYNTDSTQTIYAQWTALTISLSENTSTGASGYIQISASAPRGTVSWASNNDDVATVDSSGKVTFKQTVGTAVITATVNYNGVTNTASKTITISNSQGTKFGETSSSTTTGTVLYGSQPSGYSTSLPVTGSIPSYTTNIADVSYSSTNTSTGRVDETYANNGVDGYVYYQFNYNSSSGRDNTNKVINYQEGWRQTLGSGNDYNYYYYTSFGRQFYSSTNYSEHRAEQYWDQYYAIWWAYRDKQEGHTWYIATGIDGALAASWYRFPLTKYTRTTTTYTYYCFTVS